MTQARDGGDSTAGESGPVRGLPALLTVAMALSMLPLFLLGALGPYLVEEFDIAAPLLGVVVTVGFAVASVLSLMIGPAVGALGPRRCLIGMFGVTAVMLAVFAIAPAYGWLVAAVAGSGIGQALANPATNQLIATRVPAPRRAGVTGLKQSGVQLGAFFAGLPLAALAAAAEWRIAVGLAAATALLAAFAALTVPADRQPARLPELTAARPRGDAAWLAGFSVLLGAGISAVNTYIALYGTSQLDISAGVAGGLIAALGIAGIVGRMGWSAVAARRGLPGALLAPLALGAVLAALLLAAAAPFGSAFAGVGAVGVGAFAVAANAVSMVTVITTARPEQVGKDSAVVAAGFFAGFAVGPPALGMLAAAAGGRYEAGWLLVAVEFLGAAGVAWWWRRRRAA
ncbi:hypothetical protein GCM10027521_24060 [Amycolatopsis cihanbeyliensis]